MRELAGFLDLGLKLYFNPDRSSNDIKKIRHLKILSKAIAAVCPHIADKLYKHSLPGGKEGAISADWVKFVSIDKDSDFAKPLWAIEATERFCIPTT